MSSASVRMPLLAGTTRASGTSTVSATGARSFSGSKGSLLYRPTFSAQVDSVL
jgi:hypothetical protein